MRDWFKGIRGKLLSPAGGIIMGIIVALIVSAFIVLGLELID
jgi:hypothetical protein